MLHFDFFFTNKKINISVVYAIEIERIECGKLSFLLGPRGETINNFGNVGIEIYEDFRNKSIGTACVLYSINRFLRHFESCIIICSSDNIKMLLLLEKLKKYPCKKTFTGKYYVYEYRR